MAVSPNPRTLLLPDPEAIPSVLSDKFIPIFASVVGFSSIVLSRIASRRPVLSGMQAYAIATVGSGLLGKYGQDRYDRYNMENDAVMRHYIELHPEDFPMPERKKVGELFTSWTPVR